MSSRIIFDAGETELRFIDETGTANTPGPNATVVLHPRRYVAKVITLPPASRSLRQRIVEQRLPELYPGPPQEAIVDIVPLTKTATNLVLVVIARKDDIATIKAWSKTARVTCPVQITLAKAKDLDQRRTFQGPGWELTTSVEQVDGKPTLKASMYNGYVSRVPLTAELGAAIRGARALFRPRSSLKLPSQPVRIALFSALLLVLALATGFRFVFDAEEELANLQNRFRAVQSQNIVRASLLRDIEDARAYRDRLRESIPVNVYALLSAIIQELPTGTQFSRLEYGEGRLTLTGVSRDTIRLARSLEGVEGFTQVAIVQVEPESSNLERFTIRVEIE